MCSIVDCSINRSCPRVRSTGRQRVVTRVSQELLLHCRENRKGDTYILFFAFTEAVGMPTAILLSRSGHYYSAADTCLEVKAVAL